MPYSTNAQIHTLYTNAQSSRRDLNLPILVTLLAIPKHFFWFAVNAKSATTCVRSITST